MRLVPKSLVALAIALASPWLLAQPLPEVEPEEVGLSSERLERIQEKLAEGVEAGEIPGAVALVARNGSVAYLEAVGEQDQSQGTPMSTDSIFRMASMTKPVVSVAALILQEEGELMLTDPVSDYLPELADMRVAIEELDPETGETTYYTVPAKREMTIQDLHRHTSGITYGAGTGTVDELYAQANLEAPGDTNEDLVRKLAELPLANHPGEVWEYGYSTDVLGRVIEVVSGMPLDEFLNERIFEPLGMNDTGFYVPEEKQDRLAQPPVDPATGELAEMPDVTTRPSFISGGSGMVSTAADYARFLEMLLNGGELDGTRILGSMTVEYILADHLAPLPVKAPRAAALEGFVGGKSNQSDLPGVGYGGFGLGAAVRAEQVSGMPGNVGEYYWSGAHGTYFWLDPVEEMFAIYMSQDPSGEGKAKYRSLFKSLVTASIVD